MKRLVLMEDDMAENEEKKISLHYFSALNEVGILFKQLIFKDIFVDFINN